MTTTILAVPPGVSGDGTLRVIFVPAIADPTAPSLASEINGTGSVEATNIIMKTWGGPSNSVDKYKDERLGTINVNERNGQVTWSLDDLEYVMDPATPASDSNKLYAAVGDGSTTGFFVLRYGVDVNTDMAVDDLVWVFGVEFAPAVPMAQEANSRLRAAQGVSVTSAVYSDVAVVA